MRRRDASPSPPTFRRVSVSGADAAALLARYHAELGDRLGRFDPALDPRPADDFDPPRGGFFVADADGQPVACGGVKLLDPATAEIKQMYVIPEARGRGIGRRLLEALETAARDLGASRIVLDTAAPLVEAAALYGSAGYRPIAPYNRNPYAAAWFEKTLQNWK